MSDDYILGLDLGQRRDYSALAIVERRWKAHPDDADKHVSHYAIRHLRRWPLGTSYTVVAADLAALLRQLPLHRPVLVVDQTGVGQAVVDFMTTRPLSATLERVILTSGQQATRDASGVWHVPKKELIAGLQQVLQCRRLQVAALPERALLIEELQLFRVKITAAAKETFQAWRARDHDDLVLAVALACWWAERQGVCPSAEA